MRKRGMITTKLRLTAIVKHCDTIPSLRRTFGPQRGDYYGRWLRWYTRRQAARIALFHAYALQKKSRNSTQNKEWWFGQKHWKGMPTHLKQKKQTDSKPSLGVGRWDSLPQVASCCCPLLSRRWWFWNSSSLRHSLLASLRCGLCCLFPEVRSPRLVHISRDCFYDTLKPVSIQQLWLLQAFGEER